MTAKPDFGEQELEHYKTMVGMIIDGDSKKKREMDDVARLSIAQAKRNMPTADDETLVTFFASIAFLMAHLMNTPVKSIAEVVESTFDGYTVAAAHIIGAYDIEGGEVPVKRELKQQPDTPSTDANPGPNTGLYL